MDSEGINLKDTSKSKQVTVLDKICRLQWLNHNAHLSDQKKSKLDKDGIQHSEKQAIQHVTKLNEDEEQNKKQEVKTVVSHVGGSKKKDKEQKVQKIVSNANENKDQIEEKIKEVVLDLEKNKEQEEQKVVDTCEDERQITEYVEFNIISKSIDDKSIENSEIILSIPDIDYDPNTENNIIDKSESLKLTSEESFEDSLVQKQLSILQDVKEEEINSSPHHKEYSKQCVEMQQKQCNIDSNSWSDSISIKSEKEDEVKVEKQDDFDSNNDTLNYLTKEISQINLNISLIEVKNQEKDDNAGAPNEKQELPTEANIILDTKTITDENSKELKVKMNESNKEEPISDEIKKLEESNKSTNDIEDSTDDKQIKMSNFTTNSKESSDKLQIELNKPNHRSNGSGKLQNKKQWNHNFICSNSVFKSNNIKIDRQFLLQSRKGTESVLQHDSNSFLRKDEENIVTSFNTTSADVRRNIAHVYYVHSKERIEKVQTKEDDKLCTNITKGMFSFDKKMTEYTNDKTIVTTNEKEKSVQCNLKTKQFSGNVYDENINSTNEVNKSNSSNLRSETNVLQYSSVQANNHLSLNRNMELRNTSTQNIYQTQSSTNCFTNYMTVNSLMNNNFTDSKQAFIPNMPASNVLCVHQAFNPQSPHNMRVYDGVYFNTASKEQEYVADYPPFHYNSDFNTGQERSYMYQSTCFQPLYPTNWNGCYAYTMPVQICRLNCNTFGNQPVVYPNVNSWSHCDQMYQRIPMDLHYKPDPNNGTESSGCVNDNEECTPPMVSPKACMLAASELPTSKENSSNDSVKRGHTNFYNTHFGANNTRLNYRKDSTNFERITEGGAYNANRGRGRPKRFKKYNN